MRIRPILLLLVLSCCVSPCGAQAPLRYVNSRELVLGLEATSQADRVEAWLSQNDGQTWTSVAAELTGSRSVRLSVNNDGTYGIYLVLQNAGGRSAQAPTAGTQAHVRVTVDTTPPTLQVRKTTVSGGSGGPPQVEIRGVLLEESIRRGKKCAASISPRSSRQQQAGPHRPARQTIRGVHQPVIRRNLRSWTKCQPARQVPANRMRTM
ncbi:MAG: hypothetical protein HZB38_06795 [Planctomycetes bacterium]|nr:hypothetical protein [Planctomycetota bacterium]